MSGGTDRKAGERLCTALRAAPVSRARLPSPCGRASSFDSAHPRFARPQLLAKEGSNKYLQEGVAAKLVRPVSRDDSKSKLSKRHVGEAVDCWHEGGWWTVRPWRPALNPVF